VSVVFMTDGRFSHLHSLGIASDPSPEELAVIRRVEANKAAAWLGVGPDSLFFLDFDSESLVRRKEAAVRRLAEILAGLRPDEVYYPGAAESHMTHRMTHDIVAASLDRAGMSPGRYLYTVWPGRASRMGARDELVVDISRTLPLKIRAMNEYRSQVTRFSRQQRRPLLSRRFLARFRSSEERFLRG
jgi:LmbE family N-acetylglucosaminyl deacetylase